ncbi:centrosomal protein 43 [Corvus cornix cornix]|uniref:centrosomal protein 43 n=1 Tax=Corvus cornix cornix TaxID=932674 RepID=UPI00194DD520|nr:centrosomal protein 43 [Corvus cornix cornix]
MQKSPPRLSGVGLSPARASAALSSADFPGKSRARRHLALLAHQPTHGSALSTDVTPPASPTFALGATENLSGREPLPQAEKPTQKHVGRAEPQLPPANAGAQPHGGQGAGRGNRGRPEQGNSQIRPPLPRVQTSPHLSTLHTPAGPRYLPRSPPALSAGATPRPPLSPGPRTAPPRRAGSGAAHRPSPQRLPAACRGAGSCCGPAGPGLGGGGAPRHPRCVPGASPEHLRGQPGTPGTSPCERRQERSAEWQRAAEEVIYVDGFARPAVLAELRAAVFLALEEQEKVENKAPLVNESLKSFLGTKDGRLVAGLVAEFLRFFNLDFTLAVFQPESSTLNGLDGRENLARDLGITEAEGTVGGPLLLEVVRKCQQKKIPGGGEVAPVLSDSQCPTSKSSDGRSSAHSIPNKAADKIQSDTSVSSGEASKRSIHFLPNEAKLDPQLENKDLNTKEKSDPVMDEDDVEGDSFFDDPIPKPERTYGWKTEANKGGGLASLSDAPPLKSGLSSLTGAPLLKESDNLDRNSVLKDLRLVNAKLGSLELGNGDDDEYADDFNSTSHRSEKSDISIGEEIDELSVGTEESNASDKLESITQDLTISQLSDVADYLEDVA